MKTKFLPAASILLFSGFLVITGALGFARQDLNPLRNAISHYLVGDYSWLAILSFMLLGTGAFLLLIYLYKSRQEVSKILAVSLLVYIASVYIAGLTNPDSTLHGYSAIAAFAVVPVMVIASGTKNKLLWLTIIVGSFLLWVFIEFGTAERITTLLEVAWLIYFSLQLHKQVNSS